MDFKGLKEPFRKEQVRWRVGSTNKKSVVYKTKDKNAKPTKGIALCYVNARDVEDRLDEIVGAVNWSTRYEYNGGTCLCYITIDGVTKANGSGDTAVEAEKGAISKAFVRAGSSWGVGRYLYNAENIWVDLDDYGKIKSSEFSKLDKMLDRISKGEVVNEKAPADYAPLIKRTEDALSKLETVEAVNEKWEAIVKHIKDKPDDVKNKCQLIYSNKVAELNGS